MGTSVLFGTGLRETPEGRQGRKPLWAVLICHLLCAMGPAGGWVGPSLGAQVEGEGVGHLSTSPWRLAGEAASGGRLPASPPAGAHTGGGVTGGWVGRPRPTDLPAPLFQRDDAWAQMRRRGGGHDHARPPLSQPHASGRAHGSGPSGEQKRTGSWVSSAPRQPPED